MLATTIVYAQQKAADHITREHIISTQNPHNPLVNGIPYDQYKAQVLAAEKQRAVEEAKAKMQHKENLDQQAKVIQPPKPTVVEQPK